MDEKILNAVKEVRDQDSSVTDYDVEDYRKDLTKDLKKIAATLGSTINEVYVLYFYQDFVEEYFLPKSESGELYRRDRDVMDFWFDILSSGNNVVHNHKGPYLSREVGTSWLDSNLIKPSKNTQTYVVQAHFPWSETDEQAVLATKETFEILEIVSAVGRERSANQLKSLPQGTDPAKLRNDLKNLTTVNKLGL
jgi:hypothetical protein